MRTFADDLDSMAEERDGLASQVARAGRFARGARDASQPSTTRQDPFDAPAS